MEQGLHFAFEVLSALVFAGAVIFLVFCMGRIERMYVLDDQISRQRPGYYENYHRTEEV